MTVCLPLQWANFTKRIINVTSYKKMIWGDMRMQSWVRNWYNGKMSSRAIQTKRERETVIWIQWCVAAASSCCHWQKVKGTCLPQASLSCWPHRGQCVYLYLCVYAYVLHRETERRFWPWHLSPSSPTGLEWMMLPVACFHPSEHTHWAVGGVLCVYCVFLCVCVL